MKTYTFAGKSSTFGGPKDMGARPDEGIAFMSHADLEHAWFRYLFLDAQPYGTTGLMRRLNPDMYYIACRWHYQETPKEILRYSMCLVKNTETGATAWCRPADWGPSIRTGRDIDLSPGAAAKLGVTTDKEIVECTLMAPQLDSVIIADNPDVIVSIGHHPSAQGAEHRSGLTEWEYNEPLAQDIAAQCKRARVRIVSRSSPSWTTEDINRTINSTGAKYAIELHCNFYDGISNRIGTGTEMWVMPNIWKTYEFAQKLQTAAVEVLGLTDRGIKLGDQFLFLRKTVMPAVIVESFFIDEDEDLNVGLDRRIELAKAYAGVLDLLVDSD